MAARLGTRQSIVLATFVSAWLVLFTLKVAGALHPVAQPVAVERGDAQSYPVVESMLRPAHDRPSQLLVGDRIIAIGNDDLRGRGQFAVLMAFARAGSTATRDVPVLVDREGARRLVQEPMPRSETSQFYVNIAISIIIAIVAILILVRARPTPAVNAMVLAQMVDSLVYVVQHDGSPVVYASGIILGGILVALEAPLLLNAALRFPAEARGEAGGWRWAPLAVLPLGPSVSSAFYSLPFDSTTGIAVSRVLGLAFALAMMTVLTHNYRRSGPIGRRQVRWLMYATYLGVMLYLPIGILVDISDPNAPLWSSLLWIVIKTVFPITLLIAALRFDLFDINRLFGVTLLYNALAAIALAAGFLIVPRAADAMTAGLEIGRTAAQTMLTVALAILVLVSGRRLRARVERRFFSERFALEAAMRDLPERFATVRRAEALWELTGRELTAVLRPSACVIFSRAGDAFVPVFTDAQSRAPLVATDSPAVTWVSALTSARRIDRGDRERIGPLGAALLGELQCQLVVPVQRHGVLEAFICLGEKGSGDIFTATDESLLASLGKTLSSHMLRFDEAELLERARAIQVRMQRYVPGALADVIAEGAELETGEREVSVLFVDIRGYTAYVDGRDAGAVFSTVNRYTEAVSSIVREHGGVVVEFNGDGMMAVFGAPRPLVEKESAAVRAGVRLAREVPALASTETTLTVGVGIATGLAFVGNIEAVDRTIWSAIGATTNLAARLQAHTRSAAASVLIDAATWSRAGSARDPFDVLGPIQLRGRSEPVTVYSLTLPDVVPPSPTPLSTPRRVRTAAPEAAH